MKHLMFLSGKRPTLETLDFAFYIGSTSTFIYFDFNLLDLGFRFFSRQPHSAGSQRQKELANEINRTWQDYGFAVEMPEYDVLLSIPDENNPDYIKVVNATGKIMLRETFVTQVSFFCNRNVEVPCLFMHLSAIGSCQVS